MPSRWLTSECFVCDSLNCSEGLCAKRPPIFHSTRINWLCARRWRDAAALEREIDPLVYQLYELTPEEIAVVEEVRP